MIEPEPPKSCYLKTYGRGVGKVISACREGEEKSGALCYPACPAGMHGVGPVCWSSCPEGFRDDGAFCFKPGPYGRGVGSFSQCDNCEKWGLLWYPKCKPSFHNVACCICSPDCPEGMKDIGISCAKKTHGRGIGKPLICKPEEEMSGLLCYPPCE